VYGHLGRTGVATNRERRPGPLNEGHVKGVNSSSFATWLSNIFVIDRGNNLGFLFPREKKSALPLMKRQEAQQWVKWSLSDILESTN
jgi:hypothetical protein